jgi:hypothetical protein
MMGIMENRITANQVPTLRNILPFIEPVLKNYNTALWEMKRVLAGIESEVSEQSNEVVRLSWKVYSASLLHFGNILEKSLFEMEVLLNYIQGYHQEMDWLLQRVKIEVCEPLEVINLNLTTNQESYAKQDTTI